jgi:hypothetical protein
MARKKKKKPRVRKQKPTSKKKPRRGGRAVTGRRSLPGISGAAMLEGGVPLMPAKMSEILLEVAQPALDHISDAGDLDQYRRALLAASMAWNASRLDDPGEREAEIRKYIELTKLDDPQDREDMRAVLTLLTERAALLWPELKALSAGVEVYEDETGKLRVTAMSYVPT